MSHPSIRDILPNMRTSEDERIEEDIIIKKRKILDDKLSGLSDYLARFTTEEISTETASSHSNEHEGEDSKHSIIIPTPLKSSNSGLNKSHSNPAKTIPQKMSIENLAHTFAGNDAIGLLHGFRQEPSQEEIQRQQILNWLTRSTLILNHEMNKIDHMSRAAIQCLEGVKSVRGEYGENQKTQFERIEQIKEEKKHSGEFDSNPSGTSLFNHLFGTKTIYKYELVLDQELPVPVFRERNLVLKAILVDALSQKPVKNQNKVLMHLSLQTWEIPSNPILRNKTGNKAIMGETEVELKNGELLFDRIQINEVTSKFIHGYIAIIITPTKPVNHGTSLCDHEQAGGYINFEHIKPLMLEKVVVKSKKKKNLKKKSE